MEEKEKENKKPSLFSRGLVVYLVIAFLIPTIAGAIFWIVNKTPLYLEVFYIVVACLTLIVAIWRPRARENVNYRKTKTFTEDRTTAEYKAFQNQQRVLIVFALILLLLSLAVFLIRRFAY